MKRKLFTFAAALSLLVCLATSLLWVASYRLDSRTDGVRLFDGIRVGAFDGIACIYNQIYPYSGSIIAIYSGPGQPKWPKTRAFDFAGLYFRHFTWPGHFPGGTYWTLRVPLFYLWLLGAVLPSAWATVYARRSRKLGMCRRCGYDLRATPDGCPECGTPVSQKRQAIA